MDTVQNNEDPNTNTDNEVGLKQNKDKQISKIQPYKTKAEISQPVSNHNVSFDQNKSKIMGNQFHDSI